MTTGTVKIILKLVTDAVGGGTFASSSTDKKVNIGRRGVRRCKEKEKTNGTGARKAGDCDTHIQGWSSNRFSSGDCNRSIGNTTDNESGRFTISPIANRGPRYR